MEEDRTLQLLKPAADSGYVPKPKFKKYPENLETRVRLDKTKQLVSELAALQNPTIHDLRIYLLKIRALFKNSLISKKLLNHFKKHNNINLDLNFQLNPSFFQ